MPLWRKPKLAIVDELAHTNVPGSRHVKRYQDVEELLAAGIDVYTTLNVQHIESLNDVVARISRVRVRETLPDKVLELADEIELIDLPPDDLIQRLREGKVYMHDQVGRAIRTSSARAISPRCASWPCGSPPSGSTPRWSTTCARTPSPAPGRPRTACWSASTSCPSRRSWCARPSAWRSARACPGSRSTCTRPHDSLPEDAKDRIAEALRLAESLGGETVTLHAEFDIADEIFELCPVAQRHPHPARPAASAALVWLAARAGHRAPAR